MVDIPRRYVAIDVETTGLSPDVDIITAIGIGTPGGEIEVNYNDDPDGGGEAELLKWLYGKLSDQRSDTAIAWNAPFDFRFIRTRAIILGERNPLASYFMFDAKQWAKSYTKFRRFSLEHVAQKLGVGDQKKHEGHEMPNLYWKGERDKVVGHCANDIERLIRVYERFLESETGKKRIPPVINPYDKEEEPSSTTEEAPSKEEEEIPSFGENIPSFG